MAMTAPPGPQQMEYRRFKKLPWNGSKLERLFAEGWTVHTFSSWNNRYLLQRPKHR